MPEAGFSGRAKPPKSRDMFNGPPMQQFMGPPQRGPPRNMDPRGMGNYRDNPKMNDFNRPPPNIGPPNYGTMTGEMRSDRNAYGYGELSPQTRRKPRKAQSDFGAIEPYRTDMMAEIMYAPVESLSKDAYTAATRRNLAVWSKWRTRVNEQIVNDLSQNGQDITIPALGTALQGETEYDTDAHIRVKDPKSLMKYATATNEGTSLQSDDFVKYGIPRVDISTSTVPKGDLFERGRDRERTAPPQQRRRERSFDPAPISRDAEEAMISRRAMSPPPRFGERDIYTGFDGPPGRDFDRPRGGGHRAHSAVNGYNDRAEYGALPAGYSGYGPEMNAPPQRSKQISTNENFNNGRAEYGTLPAGYSGYGPEISAPPQRSRQDRNRRKDSEENVYGLLKNQLMNELTHSLDRR